MSINQKKGSHPNQRYRLRSQPIVRNTLQFRINLLFLLLMLAMAITIVIVIQTIGKSLMIKENHKFIEQKGHTIVTQLGQHVSYAEAITKSLANIAETLPKDISLFKKTIPQILYSKENRSRIAGGGIWPEPYAFEPKTERRSFFWGYDTEKTPVYFDNYNDPTGPGYHSEEWYVPARYLKYTDTFWSKSYIDPYSNEPMVTCTAPIFENNQFTGVSTIDLKLNNLKSFLDKEAAALKGYIFAVDRNNKFLSFPDQSYVKVPAKSISAGIVKEFINVRQLAKKEPQFQKIADALQVMNDKILNQDLQDFDSSNQLAQKIASESYQINFDEAKLIVATFAKKNTEKSVSPDFVPINIKNDFILNESAVASIFLMPKTHWKIVLVSPFSQVTGVANYISQQIFIYLAIGMLICVFIAYLYLRLVLVLPLRDMTKQLIKAVQSKEKQLITLPEIKKNELGDLAFWFNRRTEELRSSNENLKQEIHSHKKSQKALEKSEEHYRLLTENALDIVWATTLEGRFTYISPAVKTVTGYSVEEAMKSSIFDILAPSSASKISDILSSELGKPEKKRMKNIVQQAQLNNRNNDAIDVEITATWTLDEQGAYIGIQGITRDITERKKAETARLESEKKFRTIFESSRDAILITDIEKRYLDCNPAARDLFRLRSKEELLNLNPALLSPEYQPDGALSLDKAQKMNQQALEKGSHFFEWTHMRMNGEAFSASVLATKMKLGEQIVLQRTIRDITDEKRTQEMIIQAEKMMSIGGLAAGMAHEINNPLAGMIQNASVITNRLKNKELPKNIEAAEKAGTKMDAIYSFMEKRDIFHFLENIVTTGDRAAKIINNMLSFSRKSDKSFSSHRIDKLLNETLELAQTDYDLKKQYDFKQVQIIKEYDPVPLILCEKSKIQQVLLNILKNGVQAMYDMGKKSEEMRFICRIFKTGKMAVVEIKDNGPGMEENIRKRIFEPFFTTKSADKGTGLGLSVSYFIIVDDHKGEMEVESTLGKGTKFIIKLPIDFKRQQTLIKDLKAD